MLDIRTMGIRDSETLRLVVRAAQLGKVPIDSQGIMVMSVQGTAAAQVSAAADTVMPIAQKLNAWPSMLSRASNPYVGWND